MMSRLKQFLIPFVTTISGALPAAAMAAIVQVSGVAGLNQGPYTLETFENGISTPGVTYSAASGLQQANAGAFASGGTPSGSFGLSTNSFPNPITLTFAAPTSSVGMFFGNDDTCCSTGFTAFMDIFGTNGLLGTIGVVANMNDRADQFIGFTSDELVTSVALRYGNGNDVGLFTYIDDVQFNVARSSVPEPMTSSLVGLALLGLVAARQRRSKSAR